MRRQFSFRQVRCISLLLSLDRRTPVNKMEPSSDRQYEDTQSTHDVFSDRELSGYYEEIELNDEGYQELRTSDINTYLELDANDHYIDVESQLEAIQ